MTSFHLRTLVSSVAYYIISHLLSNLNFAFNYDVCDNEYVPERTK
jgi:hypothetical protein